MDCKILAGSGCSGGARGDARRIQAASAYHNAHLNQAMRFGRLQVDETLYGQAETTSPPHIKSSWLRPVEGVSFASLVDTEQPSAGTQSAASSVGTPVTARATVAVARRVVRARRLIFATRPVRSTRTTGLALARRHHRCFATTLPTRARRLCFVAAPAYLTPPLDVSVRQSSHPASAPPPQLSQRSPSKNAPGCRRHLPGRPGARCRSSVTRPRAPRRTRASSPNRTPLTRSCASGARLRLSPGRPACCRPLRRATSSRPS